MTVAPFHIHVSGRVLDDLHMRLTHARFVAPTTSTPWQAGTNPAYLQELVTYWINTFDWRTYEREINAIPQYLADVDGLSIHYLHVPGARVPGQAVPLPLILSHGW
ncbi:MAG TPA: epoxide hydrolase N-terminal domain-containing protein, partial [Anaerolineales bacterium]|nr:epoxide hydrolase N-terminal domain-containing protein [Anaerolineales bacterium]